MVYRVILLIMVRMFFATQTHPRSLSGAEVLENN